MKTMEMRSAVCLLALLKPAFSQDCFFENMDYGGGGAACGCVW